MSTPCIVRLGNATLYHHWDGYPQGVGADLANLVANLNDGFGWGYYGSRLEDLARWMANKGLPTRTGIDNGYELVTPEKHPYAEYEYEILEGDSEEDYELVCRKNNEDCWHDITPNGRRFVPMSESRYAVEGSFSHEEAVRLGLTKDLEYGQSQTNLNTGRRIIRSYNDEPSKKSRIFTKWRVRR